MESESQPQPETTQPPLAPPPVSVAITVDKHEVSALQWLHQSTLLSKQQLKHAMTKGAVWLQRKKHIQRLRRGTKPLKIDDQLFLYYDKKVLDTIPPTPTLIADKHAYSVWYKPYGLYSQGSKWGDHCTITRWVEQYYRPGNTQTQRTCFLVHRLDRAATGLILVAHDKRHAAYLAGLFQQRQITKQYHAIVVGEFPHTNALRIDTAIDNKPACSHVRALASDTNRERTLVEVTIDTGRKHQIRHHLSSIGFPIEGDRLYGQAHPTQNLQLCAQKISFACPVNATEVVFTVPDTLGLHL